MGELLITEKPVDAEERDRPLQPDIEKTRIKYAFLLAVVGLLLASVLVIFLVAQGSAWKSTDVVAVVGLFTSVLGTLVGAFFGVQVGAAGKEKEQEDRKDAERLARGALANLAPEQAERVIKTYSSNGTGNG